MAITKISTPELFDFSATNTALQLPTGPTTGTGGRPATPSTGEWRFNTTLKYVEFWDSTAWRQIDTESASTFTAAGNFNTNTYFGNGATQAIDAKFNEAANFNGSSSKIELPNLGISGAGTRTISAWINVNSLSATQTIFQFGASAAKERFGFAIDTAGKLYVEYYGRDAITSSAQITTGSWFNVAVTYNGGAIETATNTQIYVNGSAVAMSTTGTSTGAANTADSNYGIGYRRPSTSQYFNGKIDQIRIFNDELTSLEVTDLWQNETTTTAAILDFPAGAGCIAAYQLDGNANDVSSTIYNGTTTDIGYTGFKFAPDLTWIKCMSTGFSSALYDTVRGATYRLVSNTTDPSNSPTTNGLTVFNTNGFTLGGSNTSSNRVGDEYVAWCWKAGAAPTATNIAAAGAVPTLGSVMIDGVASTAALAGTIAATKISANTDAGFSIVKTGTSNSVETVGHGLGLVPKLIISKPFSATTDWNVWTTGFTNKQGIVLNNSNTKYTNGGFKTVDSVSTTTIGLGRQFLSRDSYGGASGEIIHYIFADVSGYQKIGSYIGSGLSGNFESTEITSGDGGFEPRFLMFKAAIRPSGGGSWYIFDNKRTTSNPQGQYLQANEPAQESDGTSVFNVNFNSNGFTINGTNNEINQNGSTYIYLAIA